MDKPFAAYTGDQPYVFVCYAHDDSDVVFPEIQWLKDQGFNIWYDEGISPGSEWRDELADSISNASLFLYFVSPRSISSPHCKREINFALENNLPLSVVYLEETELPSGLSLSLSSIQAIMRPELSDLDYRIRLLKSTSSQIERGIGIIPPVSTLAGEKRSAITVAVVGMLGLVFGIAGLYLFNLVFEQPMHGTSTIRTTIDLSGWEDWKSNSPARSMVISPNGETVVFVARDVTGLSKLKVRHLDRLESVELADTDGAEQPFFSPDSRWVGYFDDRVMKRVSLDGAESPSIITTLDKHTIGASWGTDGRIYYAEEYSAIRSVSASGGGSQEVTQLNQDRREGSHRVPHYVIGHQLLLFTVLWAAADKHEIWAHNLTTGERVYLFDGLAPVYIDSGYIVYAKEESGRGGSLWAVPFDLESVTTTGQPRPIQNAVAGRGGAAFSATRAGALIYLPKQGEIVGEVVLMNAAGSRVVAQADARAFSNPVFSNDGSKIAVVVLVGGLDPAIRIYEIDSGVMRQFSDGEYPLWDPGDQSISFFKHGVGLVRQRLDGETPIQTLVPDNGFVIPDTWSNQGRTLIYHAFPRNQEVGNRGFGYALESDKKPHRITDYEASYLSLTDDERWVSFSTWPRGVQIRRFVDGDAVITDVSVSGHTSRWGNDDTRLYYQDFDTLWAVGVDLTQGVALGKKERIADLGYPGTKQYDIDKSGRIVIARHEDSDPKQPVHMTNWTSMLDDER